MTSSSNGTLPLLLGMDRSFGDTVLRNSSETMSVTNGTSAIALEEKRQAIGIALAISGNIMISISLSVQKYAHNRLGDNGKYCLDKWWWLGMAMMGIGEFANFIAYGYAAASLVAPLGSVAVLANVFIAFILLREPVTPHSMIGVSLVMVGSIFLISFSAFGHAQLDAAIIFTLLKAWTFLLYVGIELVALGFLFYLYFYRKKEHLVILLLIVALFASCTVIAAKAVSTLLSEAIANGLKEILNVVFWVMLFLLPITTAIQIRFLNRAMQLYNVSDVVPMNFIFFTVSAILAGTIFYQEFYGVAFLRIFMFLFGCLLSFIGIFIISHKGRSFPCDCFKKDDDTSQIIINGKSYDSLNRADYPEATESPGSSSRNGEAKFISRLNRLLKRTEKTSEVQTINE